MATEEVKCLTLMKSQFMVLMESYADIMQELMQVAKHLARKIGNASSEAKADMMNNQVLAELLVPMTKSVRFGLLDTRAGARERERAGWLAYRSLECIAPRVMTFLMSILSKSKSVHCQKVPSLDGSHRDLSNDTTFGATSAIVLEKIMVEKAVMRGIVDCKLRYGRYIVVVRCEFQVCLSSAIGHNSRLDVFCSLRSLW